MRKSRYFPKQIKEEKKKKTRVVNPRKNNGNRKWLRTRHRLKQRILRG
jgi:hypothetical protein